MAKPFINDDFVLQTKAARKLYHDYAEGMPIFDYHCHLPAKLIADDHNFENITQACLSGRIITHQVNNIIWFNKKRYSCFIT